MCYTFYKASYPSLACCQYVHHSIFLSCADTKYWTTVAAKLEKKKVSARRYTITQDNQYQ